MPIAVLGAGFMGLLALRVVFLLILRRGETPPDSRSPRWPEATVIRDLPQGAPEDPP